MPAAEHGQEQQDEARPQADGCRGPRTSGAGGALPPGRRRRLWRSAARALPDRDVSPERDAVAAALQRVEALKVLLPRIEQAEEAQLAEVRAKLDADRDRKLRKSLAELHKQSLHLTAAYSNVVGRLSSAITPPADLLLG